MGSRLTVSQWRPMLSIFSAALLLCGANFNLVRANSRSSHSGQPVEVQMRNVMYHFSDAITVHIRNLYGQLVPTAGHELPIFDDRQSFTLQIASAEIAISQGSLASVLNTYVFAKPGAPLKDISIQAEKGKLK